MSGVALPQGTLTFLFSDIEGSTRLLIGDETAYAHARSEHLRVMRRALEAHGGVEVDTAGDGLFAVFASARSAVAAAQEAQAAFDGFRVRIGLHSGEATPTTSGYVGADVHRAARIAGAAHGAQVVLSEATRGLLPHSVDLVDLGAHRLKDFDRPSHLYQLGSGDFPPLASVGRSNLPVPQTSFLGRRRELSEVRALLDRDDVRLVTLTGPGGTGKTRLALQVAAEQSDRYPDGVWLASLAALTDPREVMNTVGAAMSIPGDLTVALASRRSLLVLDNFEHLLEAAPHVSGLLGGCLGVDVLVTSRSPLRLAGEWTYYVAPLRRDEATALLVERAAAVDRTADVAELAGELCARLDDLPLAIELAAARLGVLSPEGLLARLEDTLPLLSSGTRDVGARQRTLRATIAWSVELLQPHERTILGRLSVFADGFTLGAAEAVTGATLDLIDALVSQSLIRRRCSRYTMLQTIREYAAELLDASAERHAVEERHVLWFARLAEESLELVGHGCGQAEAVASQMAQLRADEYNLLAAVDEALCGGDVENGARVACAACWVCESIGAEETANTLCQRVVDAAPDDLVSLWLTYTRMALAKYAEMNGDVMAAAEHWKRIREFWPAGSIEQLSAEFQQFDVEGDDESARRVCEHIAWGQHDQPTTARTKGFQGTAMHYLMLRALRSGDNGAAVALGRRALEVVGADQAYMRVLVIDMLARALSRSDRTGEARTLLTESFDAVLVLASNWVSYMQAWTAATCWEQDDPRRSAVILGAAEAAHDAAGWQAGRDSWGLEGTFASVRNRIGARIGSDVCDLAWEHGKRLSLHEAIDLARQPHRLHPHIAFDLSPREQEVLRLVAEGCSNAEIAQRLVISPNTVSIHVSRVLRKLGVPSRTQAAVKARDEGLLTLQASQSD